MDRDPTPGDPSRVKALSQQLHEFADDVESALRLVTGMQSEEAILSWARLSADAFRDEFGSTPKNLDKLHSSYRMAAEALESYWPDLEHAQYQADRALADGRTAHSQLVTAQSHLGGVTDWVHRATRTADSYDHRPAGDRAEPENDHAPQWGRCLAQGDHRGDYRRRPVRPHPRRRGRACGAGRLPHDQDGAHPDYVPVPGRPEEVVLISGASPVLDLTEAFHDIFDAVTSTFRFVPAAP
ncbi:putative T7SS-secreted protein [Streptomyces sp.]|uniref:putative T7SS-secreted protein n=1 Tax=Streptomyces sp. TaxID=1931 RepID=UPI0039C8E3A9